MKRVGYLFCGLAVVALVLIALYRPLLWFGIWLLTAALYGLVATAFLYRPPEDHLGVLYRLGRFHRFVPPDRWDYIVPWIDTERTLINLQVRQTSVTLTGLVTQDQAPLDCEVKVTYQVDPRGVASALIPQVLGFSAANWEEIIATHLREVAMEVVAGQTFLYLASAHGLRQLKLALGAELAYRVRPLGLTVAPRTGVNLQAFQVADAVRDALVRRYKAVAEGTATLAAMQPMLTGLEQDDIDNAPNALLLAWAASIIQGAKPPSILVPGGGDDHGSLPDELRELLGQRPAPAAPDHPEEGRPRSAQPRARQTGTG